MSERIIVRSAAREDRRHLSAAIVMLGLASFYVLQIWQDGRQTTPTQIDGSLWPYIGLVATAPATVILLAANVAWRVAPLRASTRVVQEVASYATLVGFVAGFGLLLPTVL